MNLNLLKLLMVVSKQALYIFLIQVLSISLLLAETLPAQSLDKTIVTINLKEAHLTQVFDNLEKQTVFTFGYNKGVISHSQKLTLSFDSASLLEVLKNIAKETGLKFKQINNTISISREVKVINTQPEVIVETGSVSGLVKDGRTGEALPGATVLIEGTSIGVPTDIDGRFGISGVEVGNYTLVATFIGYEKMTKDITISANTITRVNFELKDESMLMEDVVVTGYYSLPKERATGAFSHASEKELEGITSLSVKDQLEGIVPGLLFEPNYNSDQNPSLSRSRGLIIRGQSTLGDNSPLIVVDGFPVISNNGVDPWSTINPDNVKSVTVLKDAAAASIWGAQAANGVIVITTKDGSGSKSTVNVSVEFITQPAPDLYDIPFASSAEAVDLYKSLFLDNTYFDNLLSGSNRETYEFPEVIDVLVQMKAGELTEQEGNQRLTELSRIDVRDEFQDLFYRKLETNTKVNLSYNVSSETNNLRASIMGLKRNKYAKGDNSQQVIGNITNRFAPSDWFAISFGVNFSLTHDENNGVEIGAINEIPQMSRILDEDGNYLPMIKQSYDDSYYDISTAKRRGLVEEYSLPYDWDWNLKRDIDNQDKTLDKNDLRLNTKMTFTPIKGLDIDLSYQFQRNYKLLSEYYNDETWYVRNAVNENARPDGSFPVPAGGMLYERPSTFTSHDGRFQVTYERTFGDHGIRALGGMEIRKDYFESVPYGFYGYDPQALTQVTGLNFEDEVNPKLTGDDEWRGSIPPIPTISKTSVSLSGRDDRFVSYYGNVGYTFKERYDLTGSIRLDQTNLYGRSPSYRQLPQWSVGAGWTISDELFFNVRPVNLLRLRMSYGWNGLVDKSASPYINGTPWVDPVNQLQYAAVLSTPNPGLTWEKTSNYNIGLDFAILNKRIRGGVEVYYKKSEDVLTDIEVNPTYGFYYDEATLNAANIDNKGVELDISSLIIDRGIKWQTRFNYSYNKNEVKSVKTSASNMAAYTSLSQFNPVAGQPRDYLAVAEWAGYSDEGLPQVYLDGEIKDINEINYNSVDIDKLFKFVGQRSPKHFGSWINTVSYKNFEFSVRLLYSFGHKFLKDSPPRSLLYNYQSYRNFFTFAPGLVADRWRSPEDNETASMYSLDTRVSNYLTTLTNDYIAEYNTNQVLDAGQVRLQSISLAYNLPSKLIGPIKFAKIQIQARDLGPIFLSNDEDVDPAFPKYSSSLYSAYYNVIRDRPVYSINLKVGI